MVVMIKLINEAAEPATHVDSPEEVEGIQLGEAQRSRGRRILKTLETLGEEEEGDDGGA